MWNELWLESPPTGSDHWYVFDATDWAGTPTGSYDSRSSYGALWDPYDVWVEDTTSAMGNIDVTPMY